MNTLLIIPPSSEIGINFITIDQTTTQKYTLNDSNILFLQNMDIKKSVKHYL